MGSLQTDLSFYLVDKYALQPEEILIPRLLNEIASGPLRDEWLTLLIDQESEKLNQELDVFLSNVPVPMFMLRLTRNSSFYLNEEMNSYESREEDSSVIELPPQKTGVMIIVTSNARYAWPMWFPLETWTTPSLLIISTFPCWNKLYLRTPLAQRTRSVVLICPQMASYPKPTGRFVVWTWMPFAVKRLIKLGIWNPNYFREFNDLFVDRFKDMTKKKLPIYGMNEDVPFLFQLYPGEAPRGIGPEILKTLSQWLHFNYSFTLKRTVLWTDFHDRMSNGTNELSINYGPQNAETYRYFDLSVSYYHEGHIIIIKNPPPLPLWQNIILSFTRTVWMVVLASLIGTAIAYHLLYRRHRSSFIMNSISITQGLLAKSMEAVPKEWHFRIFLLVWWICSWLVTSFYTSNLIAVLTVPVFPRKIQTLGELADSKYR
ncbi:hypothetical protein SK128_014474 [Halocaridina rubra]|uniref:Ionotropic glutamate receptor C-terminal domain-containing protein n=1 Tax=Halocaridina rubra TaxID=373956 RepID=A0AAN8X7Q3_HALRR